MFEGASKVILATEWKKFESLVIPEAASEAQRTEMRKSFYAGATVIMGILMVLSDSDISQEAGELVLQRLSEEIQAYTASLNPNNDTSKKFYWQ